MRVSYAVILLLIYLGVCAALVPSAHSVPHLEPHLEPHLAPHLASHSESRPRPPHYENSNHKMDWLVVYIIISHHSEPHQIQDHGKFNNITITSNCSESINVTVTISGENETITLTPYESKSVYVNDSTCQSYTGATIYTNVTYDNCTVSLDYSYIPCDTSVGTIFIIFFVVVVAFLTIVAIVRIAVLIYRKCRQNEDYLPFP